jgi:lycopene beta-cyclase
MIQGIDFYNYIIQFAKGFSNVIWKEAMITAIDSEAASATVKWDGGSAKSNKIFSSILPVDTLYALSQSKLDKPFLWQHFKGLLIQFDNNVFNPSEARLMDFNVNQKQATAFMYLLPLDASKALVEYTLFSKSISKPEEYDLELKTYLDTNYPNNTYQVIHEEVGAIPMTTKPLAISKSPIYVIGTLGNAVKPSTGYAFQFIQEQVQQIVRQLEKGEEPNTEVHYTRHQFYDAVLLFILHHNLMEGSEIFKRIFQKNNAATIFKFLSNTSTLWEDIQIMRSLPTKIFLPAAIKVLARRS